MTGSEPAINLVLAKLKMVEGEVSKYPPFSLTSSRFDQVSVNSFHFGEKIYAVCLWVP